MTKHDYALSRRGFCLCCLGGATVAATGAWLTPRAAFAAAKSQVLIIREAAAKADIATTKLRGGVNVLVGSGGNVAAVTGKDGKLLVDAGITATRPRLEKALADIGPEPITHLIDTHWHFDHTDGNEWLNSEGAAIMAHPNTLKHLEAATRVDDWNFDFPPSPKGALPTRLMKGNEETLKLDNKTIKLRYYGPAHTDSDISVFFEEDNVIHVGDTLWTGLYPFIDSSTGGSIDGQIAAAEANIKMVDKETVVIPGHGDIANREDIKVWLDMLVGAREEVAKMKKAGRSVEETIAANPTKQWDAKFGQWVIPPALFTRVVYEGV
ncbi:MULTISPECIES: MBL fold metallo-hydrolase [unclassified Rhizobium]|uniref:MBL fold metallo-hydrolase n=1 Tax=unclassified Rhizobium TaxID=2613769 RepID=UPI0016213C48|nr:MULTISPECIES: MBL fold metallo-hydrolase [unclassified Rhizobium]MBB3544901.1 glyoxylase-like metal-dependent hydrolase (beta-lactamase superfamily II) [Rhizobium sp. BK399]MCS4095632.1 glyoxylase-like metal-dependent hydrolase (beta-lactamase superfamily II) [Rhizobium sp. BK176]